MVFGPLREPAADHEHAGGGNDHGAVRPVGWHEIAGLAPLMALIVLIGVVPGPFLDRIRPSAGEIDKNLQSQRGSMTAGRRNHDDSAAEHHRRRVAECTQSSPGKTSMNPQIAYESVQQTLRILIPELIVLAAGVAMMTASPFFRWPRRTWCAIGAGALTAALLALLAVSGLQTDMYASVALNDSLGFYGRLVVLLSGLILLALAHDEPADDTAGEFFGAFLMINAGAMLVTTANELVFLFVGLELVSMPTYMLLYLTRRTSTTQETATKYFYLSIFSSGLLLYGLAFLYGVAGVSNLKALTTLCVLAADNPSFFPHPQLGLVAVVFVLAGLCFRVAAVPFHFYAPDVYQGSPTVLAALLSWVPKGVGFVAMVRALTAVISVKGPDDPLVRKAVMISWVVAAATMILGNTLALLAKQPETPAGLLVDRPRGLPDDRRDGRLRQRSQKRLCLLWLREHLLLPRGLRADDLGRLRRDHRSADGRSWRGNGRGSRGVGFHSAAARPGAGHLPAESQRHPASGRVLGQVRDLRLGLRRESGGQFRPVYPAGGHRRLERGRWRLLLPTDRGHDVPPTGSADRRAPRRLAGGSGRGRLCIAVTDSRALP